MVGDEKYEFTSLWTVQSGQARTMGKRHQVWRKFVSQGQGILLQAKMTLRRPRPERPRYGWRAATGLRRIVALSFAVVILAGCAINPGAADHSRRLQSSALGGMTLGEAKAELETRSLEYKILTGSPSYNDLVTNDFVVIGNSAEDVAEIEGTVRLLVEPPTDFVWPQESENWWAGSEQLKFSDKSDDRFGYTFEAAYRVAKPLQENLKVADGTKLEHSDLSLSTKAVISLTNSTPGTGREIAINDADSFVVHGIYRNDSPLCQYVTSWEIFEKDGEKCAIRWASVDVTSSSTNDADGSVMLLESGDDTRREMEQEDEVQLDDVPEKHVDAMVEELLNPEAVFIGFKSTEKTIASSCDQREYGRITDETLVHPIGSVGFAELCKD